MVMGFIIARITAPRLWPLCLVSKSRVSKAINMVPAMKGTQKLPIDRISAKSFEPASPPAKAITARGNSELMRSINTSRDL